MKTILARHQKLDVVDLREIKLQKVEEFGFLRVGGGGRGGATASGGGGDEERSFEGFIYLNSVS